MTFNSNFNFFSPNKLKQDIPTWADPKEKYTCQVISVKKEKAMLGIKTNLVYQLIPTFSNIQVSRKISQFEWLNQKLSCKFSMAFLPPLPDKRAIQQSDSKDDETECKRQLLQRWVNRISTHPVLSQSNVFRDLFLSTTDAKRYSDSKKLFDKDQYVGGQFFYLIKAPKVNRETCEKLLDQFVSFTKSMENSCAIFEETSSSFLKSHVLSVEKQYEKTANAFASLAQTFELNTLDRSNELAVLYREVGKLYIDSAILFRKKCVGATKSLLAIIREYNSILKNVPDIMIIQKTAMQKASSKKGNLSEQEESEMNDRVNVVTATLAAEVTHFHKERIEDFNDILMEYLKDQLEYHEGVSDVGLYAIV
ncbi:hypothetical protein HELRODRAFT_84767 [Helobdella robusta]|uniref:PX domain-containing protein n=1 Tax=Helobdella robusta TaxID=6412 RepID=T1G5N5_HELRO|nr:hypothetical protein HELRODRAFT_84767 [Helobdella robusta]ESN98347.1 hypothetical protein HELRODRAFT_84767 [Helobdella robusta]